jgi:hypothetical protein
MQELWLYGNALTSVPSSLGDLAELRRLWLDRNQLACVPRELSRLTRLQVCGGEGRPRGAARCGGNELAGPGKRAWPHDTACALLATPLVTLLKMCRPTYSTRALADRHAGLNRVIRPVSCARRSCT